MTMTKDFPDMEDLNRFFIKKNERYLTLKISVDSFNNKLIPMCGGITNPIIFYMILRNMIVREGWKDHGNFPIKEKFYDCHKLAMSMSTREMSNKFNLNRNTIKSYIKALRDIGWIKIEKVKGDNEHNEQNVYVFGTWQNINGKIEEYYFCG